TSTITNDCTVSGRGRMQHKRAARNWSSDVCTADLEVATGTTQTSQANTFAKAFSGGITIDNSATFKLNGTTFSTNLTIQSGGTRSEERRVGKECGGTVCR